MDQEQNMMNQGFSLLETLIMVVIIGLLITLAYPSYLDYITRTRRADGQTALIDLANHMEQYYAEHHSYHSATLATGKNTDVRASHFSPEGWYFLSITSQTTTGYELSAKAQKAQRFDDMVCQELTLNNLGIKGIHANTNKTNSDMVSHCW